MVTKTKGRNGTDYLRDTILQEMQRSQISQLEVCRRTGLRPSHLNRWFCGSRDMTGKTLGRIIHALGMKLIPQK